MRRHSENTIYFTLKEIVDIVTKHIGLDETWELEADYPLSKRNLVDEVRFVYTKRRDYSEFPAPKTTPAPEKQESDPPQAPPTIPFDDDIPF